MKKWYRVTDIAGDTVAGMRRPADDRIELTDDQAKYELMRGVIVPDVTVEPRKRKASAEA